MRFSFRPIFQNVHRYKDKQAPNELRRTAARFASIAFASGLLAANCGSAPASEIPDAAAPLKWSQVPGAASKIAVAPDGALWALATGVAGANKHLLYYAKGKWTQVAGLANGIAVGPRGTLYTSNKPAGISSFNGRVWVSLGGAGLSEPAVAADGTVYALGAVVDKTGNRAIWKYANDRWYKQPATGVQLDGSFDLNANAIARFGTLEPDGYFVLKATGAAYYYSSTGNAYLFLGTATTIAPVPGGFFELSYPRAALYYFDYASARLTPQNLSALTIAAGHANAGPWTQLYAIDSADRIWTTMVGSRSSTTVPVVRTGGVANLTMPSGTGHMWMAYPAIDGSIGSGETLTIGASSTPPVFLPQFFTGYVPLAYVTITPSGAPVTMSGPPSMLLTLPGISAASTYGLFVCTGSFCTAWMQLEARQSVTGTTIRFVSSVPKAPLVMPSDGAVAVLVKEAPIAANASTACVRGNLYTSAFSGGEFQTKGFSTSAWSYGSYKRYGTDAFYNDGKAFPAYPTVALENDPLTGDKHVLALTAFPVPQAVATSPALALPTYVPGGQPTPLPGKTTQPHNGAPYLQYFSGQIETSGPGQFEQRYGYWDARIRYPKGQGLWPTFWMFSSPKDARPTEFDIAELIDQDKFIDEQLWLYTKNGVISGITGGKGWANGAAEYYQSFDPSKAYHDYGILVLPTGTTWFIDGFEVEQNWTVPGDFATPHGQYIVLDLQVGDVATWPGPTDRTTVLPASMYLQHVRAYRPTAQGC